MVNKTGRPTKYSEEILSKTNDYYLTCYRDGEIPYIEELSLLLDISDDTINEWTKEKPEFSATIKKIKVLQKLFLMKQSNKRDSFTPGLLFQLKVNHGMIETEKRVVSGDKQVPLTIVLNED